MEPTTATDVLGGVEVLHKKITNQMDLIDLGRMGVPKYALMSLTKYLNLSIKQIAELLSVTERTIQRYPLEKHFNRTISEQILHIAQVVAKGTRIFGDRENFLSWVKHPNKAFANNIPMNLFSSRFGTEMISDELGRIEHGVFS